MAASTCVVGPNSTLSAGAAPTITESPTNAARRLAVIDAGAGCRVGGTSHGSVSARANGRSVAGGNGAFGTDVLCAWTPGTTGVGGTGVVETAATRAAVNDHGMASGVI